MSILRTKLSRIIFIVGILASFIAIHFTSVLDEGGVEFADLFDAFAKKPVSIVIYIGFLLVPALAASVVVPWSIRWVKSGT